VGGRPKTKLLSEALRNRLAQIKEDDPRSAPTRKLADNLVAIDCSRGTAAVTAASEIANRLEGRSQRIEVADVTADLRSRSDEKLLFHLQNGRWPSE